MCPSYVVQARVGEVSNTLSPGDVSSLLWAYSQLRAYPGIELMETLVTRTRLTMAKHTPQVLHPGYFRLDVSTTLTC